MAETTRDAVTVVHAPRETPYGAIVLAAIAKRFSKANESPIAFEAGKAIEPGTYLLEKAKLQEPQLLRELCLRIPSCKRMLYIDSSASLDQWINYVTLHSATPKTPVADLWQYYNKMNTHLATRTFLVGYRMTVVDVLQFAALSNAKAVCKELAKVPHVQRWYNYIMAIPGVQQAVSDIQRKNVPQVEKKPFTKEQQIDNSYKGAVTACTKRTKYADALKNAEQGKVVVRFAPEPSGYLHIGHTKAALLNDYFAKQYNGKLLLRFDDTNPVKEKLEYEETIKEDLQTLGVAFSSTSYTSDYFELMQDYAFKLIKSDLAYCDDTDVNTMRHQRTEGIESACRNLSVETNIANFEEMLKGSEKGMTYCLRAKIDMTHTNKCLRDPVIYRCIADAHHNRQGDKYKAFPTYDFACPIVDSIEGVTHALRSNEYSARIPQYNWFIEKCQLRPVEIYEFSRLNFVKTILSKRKLQWFVDNGVVNGWDDPRMPTVRGIMRKGLTLKALLEFILELGPSKAVNLMEWDKLWAKNKQVIDPIVPRFAAVGVDAVELKLDNFNDVTLPPAKRNLHPKDPSMGECDLWFAPTVLLDRVDADEIADGEEITLMRWGNAIVSTPSLHAQLNPDGDFRKTKKKLHWLPKDDDKLVKCTLKQYGDILAVDKIDPEQLAEPDDMRNFLEPVTEWSTPCLADRQLAALPRGSIVQLERRGYYIVDQIAAEGGLILISIPDGKMKKST